MNSYTFGYWTALLDSWRATMVVSPGKFVAPKNEPDLHFAISWPRISEPRFSWDFMSHMCGFWLNPPSGLALGLGLGVIMFKC